MSAPDRSTRLQRQLDLLPPDKLDIPVSVIGAGAVGSFAVITLAKMGFQRLCVFDDDRVDEHNLPNQFYRVEDLGRLKVEALADLVSSFEGIAIRAVPRRYGGEALRGIVVSAVDSMTSRHAIWRAVRYDPAVELFLDARMGGLVSIVHAVRPLRANDVRAYEASLHDDSEAAPEPCSARAIAFTVLGVSSTIARLVRQHLVDGEMPARITQDHQLGLLITTS